MLRGLAQSWETRSDEAFVSPFFQQKRRKEIPSGYGDEEEKKVPLST